ncbi:MAG: hypothetical protein LC104_18400 [Bacteroidales bacterium]|nr:hypothetical protein [Bacteroidales bacterium]
MIVDGCCPRCQFHHGWDGKECQKCRFVAHYGTAEEANAAKLAWEAEAARIAKIDQVYQKIAAAKAAQKAEAAREARILAKEAIVSNTSTGRAIARTIAKAILWIGGAITTVATLELSFRPNENFWKFIGDCIVEFIGNIVIGIFRGLSE